LRANFYKYQLNFKQPAGTSRGVLHSKDTYFIVIEDDERMGIGECNLFKGLSSDDVPEYESKLQWVCEHIALGLNFFYTELVTYPSILFGVEQAFLNLQHGLDFMYFPSEFTEGKTSIPINGLVWMGDYDFMKQQIVQKIESGYNTIKLKVGAIDFEKEIDLLRFIRKNFSKDTITIRLDANGAFTEKEVMTKLQTLAKYDIHSIEQPVKTGQWQLMQTLCKQTPIPIALDEELIGIHHFKDKTALLSQIQPQFIILKPALHGGFKGCEEWISIAKNHKIGWWITSALESNLGLNAIAQFTYQLGISVPQGLGTGGLYTNNFESPLFIEKGNLLFNTSFTNTSLYQQIQ